MIINSKGIPKGKNKFEVVLKWLCIFLPVIIFVITMCVIFLSPLKNNKPFAMDISNLFASIGVFFSASAVCLLVILSIELVINMINASKNPKKDKKKKEVLKEEKLDNKIEAKLVQAEDGDKKEKNIYN